MQLLCARRREHGVVSEVWKRGAEENVAQAVVGGDDSKRLFDDGAGRCRKRCNKHWAGTQNGEGPRRRLDFERGGKLARVMESEPFLLTSSKKWWSSGAGDLRCKVYFVFGKTDPTNKNPYQQHSVLIVPADVPGITVKRVLSVIWFDHAPEGHAHVSFHNVHVPKTSLIMAEGRGFEVVQGRLGPGRIHHAMRSIGAVGLLNH